MISELSISNFKGNSGSYSFGTGNYIQGANASGKTAIIQSIRAAALGYVPGHTAKLEGIRDFASDWPCQISLQTNVGAANIRFEKKAGKVSTTAQDILKPTLDKASQVLFDPTLFFGLSEKARISKAIELVSPPDLNRAAIVSGILELAGEDAEMKALVERWAARARGLPEINDMLTDATTFFAEQKKAMDAEAKTMGQTTEGLTDLSVIDSEAAALPSKAELQARRQKISAEIQTKRDALSTAKSANRQLALNEAALSQQKATAAKAEGLEKSLAEIAPMIADAEAKLTAARDQVDAVEAERFNHLESEPLAPVAEEFAWESAPLGADLQIIGTVRKTEQGAEVVDVTKCRAVPTAEAVTAYHEALEAFSLRGSEITAAVNSASEAANTAAQVLKALTKQADNLKAELAKATAAKGFIASMTEGRTATSQETLDQMQGEIDGLQVEMHDVEAKIDQQNQLENDRKRVKDAAEKRDKLKASIGIIKKIQEKISEKKQEILALCIDRPLAIANQVGEGILRGRLVFQEGELGMLVGTQFISSKTFSGSESATVVIGLCAGLAAESNLRTLILDEVGTFDNDNAKKLVANLNLLVQSNSLSQWIIVGPTNPQLAGYVSDVGAKVISL